MIELDPYASLDEFIQPWASKKHVRVLSEFKDCPVRTFWVFDNQGRQRAQIWLDPPSSIGIVYVHAAELDPTLGQWGKRERLETDPQHLGDVLEVLWLLALSWAGPGAFT